MPRRSILSGAERASLLAMPDTKDDLIQHYTFSETDLSIIRQRRGATNRLGFAVQLCYLRFPGIILGIDELPFPPLLKLIANQLKVNVECWSEYGQREQTRLEHLVELQTVFGFQPFTMSHYRKAVHTLTEQAMQTDKGIVLANALIEHLRRQSIILPVLSTVGRASSEAITRANRRIYDVLTQPLSAMHRRRLDGLLERRENGQMTWLGWLRLPPVKPNSRHMLEHIERLKVWQALELPPGIERLVHQNRLLKIAREGGQMTPANLAKFEAQRRYATLVALAVEGMATVTDEIIDLHDRILGKLFNAAKNKHQQQFQASGKAINAKVRLFGRIGQALIDAKQSGHDPFAAIEGVMSWDAFATSVSEAQKLAQPESFDFLHRIAESYATVRRYAPELLAILKLRTAPAGKKVFDAVEVLRGMNSDNARKVPPDAPTDFIKPRWQKLVMTDDGIDRRYYELCALSELKNSLRSGDIWVQSSRQFKDFEDYLVPPEKFASLKQASELSLPVEADCDRYLHDRLTLLETRLATVNRMALGNLLPDAILTESGLRITPLDAAVPDAAQVLIDQTAMSLPHVKITELLLEVDGWTNFTRHFAHLKSGDPVKDKNLLLTTILADAINLGLTKLAWLQAWHIRDETYGAALAELVNAQFQHPFAEHWGDGSTSSSDGQNFRTGSKAESTGHINPKYGSSPGRTFYTHISDQYAPFHTKVVNVGVRDSTYVLDGLLYHESDLRIEEHYTDTAGFTDHVFALMHLLGFRFAPRIRDLSDTKLYIPKSNAAYDGLKSMIGGTLNIKHVRAHWDEILRLATSIKQGTVTASLMLRKLSSYPRQNGLAIALRELGRIERTLFILDWLQNVELRRRVHAGLNKGEARNALTRAVFFNRLGEIRDRSFEQQRYRASGLNLVTAAIVLWNTVYIWNVPPVPCMTTAKSQIQRCCGICHP
jgi:TnpA family transposase